MTANTGQKVSGERLEELRVFLKERLEGLRHTKKEVKEARGRIVTQIRMDKLVGPYYADLLAVLDDYERLRLEVKYPDPESMPAELAAKFCPFKDPLHFHHD